MIDRKTAPVYGAIENINLLKPAQTKLKNGCDVFLL
jgi:hypothetical protein